MTRFPQTAIATDAGAVPSDQLSDPIDRLATRTNRVRLAYSRIAASLVTSARSRCRDVYRVVPDRGQIDASTTRVSSMSHP